MEATRATKAAARIVNFMIGRMECVRGSVERGGKREKGCGELRLGQNL